VSPSQGVDLVGSSLHRAPSRTSPARPRSPATPRVVGGVSLRVALTGRRRSTRLESSPALDELLPPVLQVFRVALQPWVHTRHVLSARRQPARVRRRRTGNSAQRGETVGWSKAPAVVARTLAAPGLAHHAVHAVAVRLGPVRVAGPALAGDVHGFFVRRGLSFSKRKRLSQLLALRARAHEARLTRLTGTQSVRVGPARLCAWTAPRRSQV